ncbi:phage regulatory protein/antirepressor Ant [Acetobacter sp. TBRC 12305]|uniref:Phage regulatory protein/antirepressor Ant n=1 Tax=Acetobacter garciniae TaxID=2817435 RepID=A0A939HNZ5_9PROT|nr:phage regulatory protein/antirepressor Ant [Acetobacter garciniae]MBO1325334.1 phage regulatory protein/antirepressor Ant [Acetobacter garciniae]MBX0345494.1 phage regulatory protein/antirepressor Ant [Acetobacter garciniae]
MMTNTITEAAYSTPTMSSREIAELTGKRHDHVVRDIEKMLTDVGEGLPKFGDTYINEQNGQEYRCYNLPKNLTLNLVTGYRADMRLKIIDRWLELEARPQPKHEIPQTLHEALRLAADTEEKRIAAEAKVVALTPKAEALDRISVADGSYGLYEAAKILQIGPKKFVQWMASNGWVYKRTGSKTWLARQEKINAGYLWHKVRAYTDSNGEEKTRDDVRVLPKGLTKLAQVIPGAAIDPYLAPEDVPPFPPAPARTR